MGEEWRRGWHPEIIKPKKSNQEVLVVGGGPAGLECARALGQRGYSVALVEARRELGGRVALEAKLPGLNEWRRVIDWRLTQIKKMSLVTVYPGSPMQADEVLEAGYAHVILATGSHWRRDGLGRSLWQPIPGHTLPHVFTPDDLMAGQPPGGRVVIFDDDHYYMGGVLAELLAVRGCEVALVTPAPVISYWTHFTLEQERIQQRLAKLGVCLYSQHTLKTIQPEAVTVSCLTTGAEADWPVEAVGLVTDRQPNDGLYYALKPALAQGKLQSLRVIGDAEAPHLIAQAVFAGYLAACEFEEPRTDDPPFKLERAAVS
jgi:dimethylamine/trimethylamine dehydrogenase